MICFVGDGSYMMANSELATAVMRRVPFTIVLTDNRGYGCINRLQQECGGAEFNNLYKDTQRRGAARDRLRRPRRRRWAPTPRRPPTSPTSRRGSSPPAAATIPTVIVIDTDAVSGTGAGGHWWDVAVPQVGGPERLEKARDRYEANARLQRALN